MAWTYIPAQNPGSEAEQPARWVDYSTPGYPLISYTDPALGFADKNAALESLYLPMAGGNTAQMQSLISANPDAYSKFGINAGNAASQTDSTFYDRLHNIDNDPLAKIMNPVIEGGIGAAVAAGLGNFAGLTSFGDGSWLNNLFGNAAGAGVDGITSTMASGANPTQVAGTSFFEGATPGLDLGPNNLWSGAYEYAGNPSLVADAVGAGSAPWWQGLPGVSGLENLGTGAPYGNVLNEGSGLWDTLTRGAKSLFGSGAASSAGALFGTGGNTGGLFNSLFGNSGVGSFLDKAAASAPVLAAIQYARNQSPLDTGKLEGLYGSFDPNALAFGYDQNTVAGRESLTSGLTSRGVMGSSFGNNDITNFNTTRDLGRSALVNQGMGQRADIAKAIMDANFKSQQLKNNLYGSSLLALGNVFGGRSSPTLNFGGM